MRWKTVSAVALTCIGATLWSEPAAAGKFPDFLKSCDKSPNFLQEEGSYAVPVVGGGADLVKVVAQNYHCVNKVTRSNVTFSLRGMTDAGGKTLIPFKYDEILPYSTTGALVRELPVSPYRPSSTYRTYTAGKGEGKEGIHFQKLMMLQPDDNCRGAVAQDTSGGVSAVIGEEFFNISGGRSHVTLFTPTGKARKLEFMGGDGLQPAVQRIGDVLLARWRDEQGVARSGILDLDGRQIAPVLGNTAIWVSRVRDAKGEALPGCQGMSKDLFIEGPSLDIDPARPFFGPLLTLVGLDGQPVELPAGAIGMFPVYPFEKNRIWPAAPNTDLWAVVFPNKDGFEFTLHLGAPAAALITAGTAPRYSSLQRHLSHGLIMVRAVADGRWRVLGASSTMVEGEGPDPEATLATVVARLEAEARQLAEARKAAWENYKAELVAAHKAHREMARRKGRLCDYRVDGTSPREEVEEYIITCGPRRLPGLEQLARDKGVPESSITQAKEAERKRDVAASAAREQEEQARLARLQNAKPGSGYYPGKWSSAIHAYGNGLTESIKKSGENWLEQRQRQYNADWQRSQRAY
jgi:hypothetical protein